MHDTFRNWHDLGYLDTLRQTFLDNDGIFLLFLYLKDLFILTIRNKTPLLTSHEMNGCAVHWLDLYEALKTSRPENQMLYNAEVTQVNSNDNKVNLTINHDKIHSFDYCIFTDDGTSIGRQYLFPDLKLSFTDTIIWRGILNKHEIEKPD